MQLGTAATLDALKAIGEETRLRVVALLSEGELTVSDLTEILGQSQPRISRHLKLLYEAGVVDRHREGAWSYFELVDYGPLGDLTAKIIASIDRGDPILAGDLDRLEIVRRRRAASAQEYFSQIAPIWDEERSLHASDDRVEAEVLELLGSEPHRTVLDLGTGTARMLRLIARHEDGFERAVGLDNSHSMLAVARANLERAEIGGVDLRQGDAYSPPLDNESFDLIVVHQVLHYLDDPGRAIHQASRLLTPGGRILIVDFAPHRFEFLRAEHAHRRLGIADDAMEHWFERADLVMEQSRRIGAGEAQGDGGLDVSLWIGRKPIELGETEVDAERSGRNER